MYDVKEHGEELLEEIKAEHADKIEEGGWVYAPNPFSTDESEEVEEHSVVEVEGFDL